jgi:hypothetical protein
VIFFKSSPDISKPPIVIFARQLFAFRVQVRRDQQPGGCAGDTPGVAAAPVALAGAIMPGVARFIVTLSAQAEVLGVGTTFVLMPGSMLVSASCPTSV